MAALLIESFDHYVSAAELTQGGFTSAGTPTFSAGRYTRGYRVELPTATEDLTFVVAATTTFYFGASIYIGSLAAGDTIVSFDDSATEQLSIRVTSLGRIYVSRAGTTLKVGTGAESVLQAQTHNYIEFTGVINDSTGSFTLRVNEAIVATDSNVDTKNTASTTFDTLKLHGSANLLPSFDDLYLNDATGGSPYNGFLGEHELITLRPNGDGYQNDWTPVGAGSTNSDRVDDNPGNDGDTTYVNAVAINDIDSWTYENCPITADNILSVQLKAAAKSQDAADFRQKIRSVATDEDGTTHAFTTSYAYYRYQSLTDPNTAAAWTNAGWTAAEAGVEYLG